MELCRLSTGMRSPPWSSSRTTLLITPSKAEAIAPEETHGSATLPSGLEEGAGRGGNSRCLDASNGRELFPSRGQSWDALTGRKRLLLIEAQRTHPTVPARGW